MRYKLLIILNFYRFIIVFFLLNFSKSKIIIVEDTKRWIELDKLNTKFYYSFFLLLLRKKEFRNLVAYRFKSNSYLVYMIFKFFFPLLNTLFINTREIGPGLYIQHGFSTIITAKKIGRNCFVNQQVTIGYEKEDSPIIKDNVRICCGAKVIGKCVVGNNVVIGANAVVVKDVQDNVTVGGVPAKVINTRGNK